MRLENEKGISPNYVPDKIKNGKNIKKGKGLKIFAIACCSFLGIAAISLYVIVSMKDDLTYTLITNCENNIRKHLISPNSFSFVSAGIAISSNTREPKEFFDKKKNASYNSLILKSGYIPQSYSVSIDYLSKNRFNAEIKNTAYCRYMLLSSSNSKTTPELVFLAVENKILSPQDFSWLIDTERIRRSDSQFKRSVWINKIKYSSEDISSSDISKYSN